MLPLSPLFFFSGSSGGGGNSTGGPFFSFPTLPLNLVIDGRLSPPTPLQHRWHEGVFPLSSRSEGRLFFLPFPPGRELRSFPLCEQPAAAYPPFFFSFPLGVGPNKG